MKGFKRNFIIAIILLSTACQDRRAHEEKLVLESVIKESTKYHQDEIDQGNNILLISKRNIPDYVKENVEQRNDKYPDWESLTDSLIYSQCGETDSVGLFNINNSNIVLKTKYNQVDSAFIFGGLAVSDICFNKEYSKAVIYVDFICGGECGFSSIYFLRKEDEEWKYVGELGLGVS